MTNDRKNRIETLKVKILYAEVQKDKAEIAVAMCMHGDMTYENTVKPYVDEITRLKAELETLEATA